MHGWQLRSVGKKNNQMWREMKTQCLFMGLILLAILADVEARKRGVFPILCVLLLHSCPPLTSTYPQSDSKHYE